MVSTRECVLMVGPGTIDTALFVVVKRGNISVHRLNATLCGACGIPAADEPTVP